MIGNRPFNLAVGHVHESRPIVILDDASGLSQSVVGSVPVRVDQALMAIWREQVPTPSVLTPIADDEKTHVLKDGQDNLCQERREQEE